MDTTKMYSTVFAPHFLTSSPAAFAEPPVAIKSSMTSTFDPDLMESDWHSKTS